MEYTIHPIAHIRTDFTDKFGIPRQSGLVPELTARIVFEPEYRDPNALVAWAATSAAASLRPAAPTARTRWGFPAWSWRASKTAS